MVINSRKIMQARNYELLKGNYTVKHSNVNGILLSVDNTSQSWGYLRSKFEFILYCGKLKSQPRQRSEDWSGTIWMRANPSAGEHSPRGAWLSPAEQSLPHWCADSGDASRGAWPPNLCWSHSPKEPSIAMPANCASTQELDSMIHVDLFPTHIILCFCDTSPWTPSASDPLLSPTKPFLFLFFLLFALVFSLLPMPCLCVYIQGLYSFYCCFLVNKGLGCNPPIAHSKGAWLTSLSESTEKSAACYSFIFFSGGLLGLPPVLCQCPGLPAPQGHLGEV